MSEFKVGDRVYCPFKSSKIEVVKGCGLVDHPIGAFGTCFMQDGRNREHDRIPSLIKATPENYELLSKLHPNVEFEKPKAVGSDLTRQMLANGAKEVLCWVDDGSDEQCVIDKTIAVVFGAEKLFESGRSLFWKYAVPVPRNHYAMDDSDE